MKIHGICPAKNEADIFDYFLRRNVEHFDAIYVFDNGSEDRTWEIAQEWAARDERVVAYRSDPGPFGNRIRRDIFEAFRDRAAPGDWWCRLDADEFYVDEPRAFLAQVPSAYQVVWSAHFNFYLTEGELSAIPPGDNGAPPVFDGSFRPRYYRTNASEARFFRHRDGLVWPEDAAWPAHMGLVAPRRIRLRHYQYRSPGQIQVRIDTRRRAREAGYANFKHAVADTWQEKLAPVEGLREDTGDDSLVLTEGELPRHMEPVSRRLLKRFMHGTGIWP